MLVTNLQSYRVTDYHSSRLTGLSRENSRDRTRFESYGVTDYQSIVVPDLQTYRVSPR